MAGHCRPSASASSSCSTGISLLQVTKRSAQSPRGRLTCDRMAFDAIGAGDNRPRCDFAQPQVTAAPEEPVNAGPNECARTPPASRIELNDISIGSRHRSSAGSGQYSGQLATFGLSSSSCAHCVLFSQNEQQRCMSRSTSGSIVLKSMPESLQPPVKQLRRISPTFWRDREDRRMSARHPGQDVRVPHFPMPAVQPWQHGACDSGSTPRSVS